MEKIITHYDILQVCHQASPSVIRAAFKALSQKWHPDKHPDLNKSTQQKYQNIKQAFDLLSNPKLRQEYDQQIKNKNSSPNKNSKELLNSYTFKEKKTRISVIV
ncbi:MAG: J domain-containing protein [Gammaproteobacteria bacterium]|nr:J domain-containing protein [Gammaproteobacteria bacterium]